MDELFLISEIFGEGSIIANKLRAKGFDSLERVVQADPAELAELLEATENGAEEIIQLATDLLAERTKDKTEDLSLIRGVGESTSEKLFKGGFKTIGSISMAEAEEISEKCNIPIAICEKIVIAARKTAKESMPEVATTEEDRTIYFRRLLARLIVKELFD